MSTEPDGPICNNCAKQKNAVDYYKTFINKEANAKDKLSRTFYAYSPFIFHDSMQNIQSTKRNLIVNQRELNQQKAIENLEKEQLKSVQQKEKLQRKNESCLDIFSKRDLQDPRYMRLKKKFDQKEKFINDKKDLYNFNQPRKAIADYYKKNMFEIPLTMHNYVVTEEYKCNYRNELKQQMKNKYKMQQQLKQNEQEDEKKLLKNIQNYQKIYGDLQKKHIHSVQKNYREYNNNLHNYNKIIKLKEHNNDKDDYLRRNKLLRKEELNRLRQINNIRNNNIEQLNQFFQDRQNYKDLKLKSENYQKNKWNKFNKDILTKCRHSADIGRCTNCNNPYPMERMQRNKIRRKEMNDALTLKSYDEKCFML